jgi:hypothetical protein
MRKKSEPKVLPFPPPKQPAPTSLVCQIGSERFAIHWVIEDLPPVAPLIVLKGAPSNRKRLK